MKPPFRFDIVGFDLDGTLVDTVDDLAAAVNAGLAADGRAPVLPAQVRRMIGGGARNMLAQALAESGGGDEALLDRLLGVLTDHYTAHLADSSRPFPGVVAALDTLAARDVRLAVVTNKRDAFTEGLLAATGLRQRFACVIGGDTLGPGQLKPSAAPILAMIERCGGGSAVFVGDSIYDVTAAHAAGIPAIAYRHGYSAAPVEELGAEAIIDHFDELTAALETL